MIVILVIAVLLMVAVPSFLSARARSRQKSCLSNQRLVNGAKDQFAMENGKTNGDLVVSGDLAPAYIKQFPFCPEGGIYSINPVGQPMACSVNAGPYKHIP